MISPGRSVARANKTAPAAALCSLVLICNTSTHPPVPIPGGSGKTTLLVSIGEGIYDTSILTALMFGQLLFLCIFPNISAYFTHASRRSFHSSAGALLSPCD